MSVPYPDIYNFMNLTSDEKGLISSLLCQFLYTYHKSPLDKWEQRLNLSSDIYSIHSVSSLKYMVLNFNDFNMLVINGTDIHNGLLETIKDLSISLNVFPYKGKDNSRFHRGYYRSAIKIANEVIRLRLIDETVPLVITGHSMGGAISKVLSSEVMPWCHTAITFGSPQVTNDLIIRDSIDHVDYVKAGDIIPWYPSSLYHGNTIISYINRDSSITRVKLPKDAMIRSIVKRVVEVTRQNVSIFDPHAITTYTRHFIKRSR